MNKILLVLIMFGIFSGSVSAKDNRGTIYSNGVKDSFTVGERYFGNIEVFTNPEYNLPLKGYATFVKVSNLNEAKIVRISALGIKNGFNVRYVQLDGEDVVIFSVVDRKADAVYVQKRLESYNVHTRIEKINIMAKHTNLVGRRLFSIINKNFKKVFKNKDNRIAQLEKYIRNINNPDKKAMIDLSIIPIKKVRIKDKCKCPKIKEIIVKKSILLEDLKELQVVNRVVTKDYLVKLKKERKELKPLNNYTAKIMTIEKVKAQNRIVAINVKNDFNKKLPDIKSFSKIYKYLRKHAGITKNDIIILHGKAYQKNDKLLKWVITSINHKTGIIVLDNSYSVQISKKRKK